MSFTWRKIPYEMFVNTLLNVLIKKLLSEKVLVCKDSMIKTINLTSNAILNI